MLIRTQDKRSLVDMTGLTITINQYKKLVCQIGHEDTPQEIYHYHIEYPQGKFQVVLGIYSTEEKAMKVLDVIQEKYEEANNYYVRNTVFAMPADEEVEV